MTRPFVHLHVHTEYSLLDGAIRTKDLARKVSGWEVPAVAMTDHGAMYGAVEFYENCRANGVKPILGCEIYVDPDGHRSREKKGKNNHLILLAEDDEGYRNLIKLVSIANTDGFYYKPRIDHDLLARHAKGLIASSACLAGEIPQLILGGRETEAADRAQLYRDIMGEGNFFLEIMSNTLPEQALVNKALVRISRETGIPLIATSDAHYLDAEDFGWHKILLRVNTRADDTDDAFGFSANDFYLRSPEEMNAFFGAELPQALDNTVAIAERCRVELDLKSGSYQLPSLDLADGVTLETHLEEEARAGLRSRLRTETPPAEYSERLEYELGVINSMGFAAYFLIVAGIIQAAKDRSIPIGPGRGSAAGSLVAWSLRITDLDPLKYRLLFERFLNPERISMPDIDTDVSDKGRDEVLKYIVERYGSDRVSQIITFGRMKSRQAVKDVGRATGVEYALMDRVAKLIPADAKSIGEALERTPELRQAVQEEPRIREVLDVAAHIEGLARHASQHAAGVVITPVPMTDLVPIRRIKPATSLASDGGLDISQTVTQFTMEPIEKLGLVKMDFLGLSTLSIIEEALENIRLNGKPVPDLDRIPMDDPAAYSLLQEADTMGIFQLESSGMRAMLRKLRIDCFEDLIAALAMYRPGPLESGMVDQYIDCKHGRARPHYPHPLLEDVLRETYGVILYQEQVMQCASVLAGYTLGEADLLRRAMGKKKVEVMQEQRAKFLDGAARKGIEAKTAEGIFDLIEKFAGYGFNKSHSAAYAVIAYHTAYLKANYKAEFMAAYLSSQMKAKKEVLAHYVREVRRGGLSVLPPDINSSMESFTAVGDLIRFGLGAVSRVGHNAVDAIVAARREGKFKSLWDFVRRVDLHVVNRATIENLVKAGAFDEILPNRRRLVEVLAEFVQGAQRLEAGGSQLSLFDLAEDDPAGEEGPDIPEVEDYALYDRLDYEKEVTGLYISGHPFDGCEEAIGRFTNCSIADLPYWQGRTAPKVGGILLSVTEKTTKKGAAMGQMLLEDSNSSIEMVAFPRTWEAVKPQARLGVPCVVEGRMGDREPKNFIVERLTPLSEAGDSGIVRIRLRLNLVPRELNVRDFAKALRDCRGASPVLLEFLDDRDSCVVYLNDFRVDPSVPSRLETRLSEIVPLEALEVVC
ncbi:MAG: DNA polymerase III subunit alpha [Fretibacterium sp.]|nr:DNA polymerase III subunit alpha [Fretibacterium sp.]